MSTVLNDKVYDIVMPLATDLFGISEDRFTQYIKNGESFSEFADSLDMVEFNMALESKLNVNFTDADHDSLVIDCKYTYLHGFICKIMGWNLPHVEAQPCPHLHLSQAIIHVASGREYVIIELPEDHKRLEDCNEPYYRYVGADGIEWSRRVSQMHDGRFKPV